MRERDNYEMRDAMLMLVKEVILEEEIRVLAEDLEHSLSGLVEGLYYPDQHLIKIDNMHANGGELECFILAHELGHHFDLKTRPRDPVKEDENREEREKRANEFMVSIAEKFGLKEEAEKVANNRMIEFR